MNSLKTYKKMLGFTKPYTHLFIISIILSIIIVLLNGIALWFVGTAPKVLFDPNATAPLKPLFSLTNLNNYLSYWTYGILQFSKAGNPFTVVCVLIVVVYTVKNILFYIYKLLLKVLNLNIVRDVRNLLYRHVLMLPVSYYDRNRSGRIVSHVVNDITQINKSLTDTLSRAIMEPLHLFFFVGMLFVINMKLTLLVFLIYPVLIYLIVIIGKIVKRRSRRMLENFSGMISVLTETIHGIRAVKMFNMNASESEKFERENKKFIRSSFRSEKVKAILIPLTETLAMYVTAILLWYGGKEALSGSEQFTPEDFVRFLVFLFSSYQPLKKIGTINNTIQVGIAAAERVFEVLNIPVEELQVAPDKREAPAFENGIRFDHVWFKYPGTGNFVLEDVDFSVKKGEVIAIVGSSGAGKTTVLDLLPRFYDIGKGTIRIDERDTKEINLLDLRNLFGIVSQETILFNDTVLNNIMYGSGKATREEVVEAATAANAVEFIEKLPEGFDTVIGEQGVMLSGGQRQRLAIARALLKNPQILIFDEATSALDTESERLVQSAIDNLIHNRTTFVVAHRLSTIQHADTIIVLEEGRIIERGSHEELIGLNKRYKYFYDIQFSSAV